MKEIPCVACECCRRPTTGEIQYRPLHRNRNYVLCPECAWKVGNLCDMVRIRRRIPTYQECMKRLRQAGLEIHAVLPQGKAEYRRLVKFWQRTHPRKPRDQ